MEIAEIQIVQLFPDDLSKVLQPMSYRFYSVGIHPCQVDQNYKQRIEQLRSFASFPWVVAIGEAGFDKRCSTNSDLQKMAFTEMAMLAEQIQKPLIIHCVKAWQEIIALHKSRRPSVPWMIHGFRGKPALAQSLLNQGFYLSHGDKFNPDSVLVTPLDRLCIETDESTVSIETLYRKIAFQKHVPVYVLFENANGLFRYLDIEHTSPCIDAHTHRSLVC
jgi:TatD DNase family protein